MFSSLATSLSAANNPPLSIEGLAELAAASTNIQFTHRSESIDQQGVRRQVVSFEVDQLEQYALVLWPAGEAPKRGWPLLIYNHGFHPDPLNYGRIDGVNARPGAYYWEVVQAYVNRGFVVVVADYRGHNDSADAEQSAWQTLLESFSRKMHGVYKPAYRYARDVIAAYFAAVNMAGVNDRQVYMAGHSMGGGITQRSLIVLGDRINAASIWSTSKGHMALEAYWPRLQVPLLIQHGKDDPATSAKDSQSLAAILEFREKKHQLVIVDTALHLFAGDDFDQAIARDIAWFTSHP